MTDTPLDHAFRIMDVTPDDAEARRGYYHQLCDTELYVPVLDAMGESFSPDVFAIDPHQTILGFDTPERLSAFFEGEKDYVALPARSLLPLLVGQDLALLINPEVAPSSNLLPPDVLAWVVDVIATMPEQAVASMGHIKTPSAIDENFIKALDRALGGMPGAADKGMLFDSDMGWGVCFLGAAELVQPALAKCVNDAVSFAAQDDAQCSVIFLDSDDPKAAAVERVSLVFDLPKPVVPKAAEMPGGNPDQPPKLR